MAYYAYESNTGKPLNGKLRSYAAPIEQYHQAIPQKWWQRLLRRPVAYRLRIRRSFPQHINCRCVINLNLEVPHGI